MTNRNVMIEKFLNKGWPALETYNYDNCLIRFANGLTKRANSVSVSGSNPLTIKDNISYCEDFYTSKNLPTIFKLLSFNHDVDILLESLGYIKKDESFVMELNLDNADFSVSKDVLIEYDLSEEWINNFINKASKAKRFDEVYQKMFNAIVGEKISACIKKGNSIIAFGYAYIDHENAGIFDIYVDEKHRGCSYGRKIVETLLFECKKKAKKAYLQVVKDNDIAINLYDNLGFNTLYNYWYRVK